MKKKACLIHTRQANKHIIYEGRDDRVRTDDLCNVTAAL